MVSFPCLDQSYTMLVKLPPSLNPLIGRHLNNMLSHTDCWACNGPLTRCVKLRVEREPGIPGTFSLPPRVSDPDTQHDTCVTHVPWCMLGSLTSGFLWSRWRVKRSWHSWHMHNQQFYVFGKSPMVVNVVRFWWMCQYDTFQGAAVGSLSGLIFAVWLCTGSFLTEKNWTVSHASQIITTT